MPAGESPPVAAAGVAPVTATGPADTETHPGVGALPHPVPIGEQSWPEGTVPLVSICCITYNHGPFIRQCLDGFLMQETTFPVEILIHDDASTDDTAAVIREYAAQYPALIRPILQTENQHSRGIAPISHYVIPKTNGRYIATCEGDDYWTDSEKLQKQVDFLEANSEYVITYHDAKIIDEDGRVIGESKLPFQLRKDLTSDQLRNGAWTLTLTRCFRNVIREFPDEYQMVLNRDIFFTVLLSVHGHGKYMDNIQPAVYRQHSGGIWSSLDRAEREMQRMNTSIYIYCYLRRRDSNVVARDFLAQSLLPVACEMSSKYQALVMKRAELEQEIRDIKSSYSFRMGRLLTMPFRKILGVRHYK